jgi:hypothetical protein
LSGLIKIEILQLDALPEDSVFGTWYYLSLKNFFLEVVPGTKFFRSKNKVFGPVQMPKKSFFRIFFSSISKGLCTGTKGEK